MPHKTFFWFFFPTGLAMILFIGLPIVSSFFQSLHIENQQILMEVENCDPFGCTTNVRVDVEATEKLKEQMESEIPLILKNEMVIQFHEERLIDLEERKNETH